MWNWAVNLIATGVTSAFGWLGSIFDAAPGAWSSLLTIFVILAVSRYLLGPILGMAFSGASDRARKSRDDKGG